MFLGSAALGLTGLALPGCVTGATQDDKMRVRPVAAPQKRA